MPNVNNDFTDPLLIEVEYEYDKVGNVISKIKSSPSSEHKKIVKYEYGDEYKYKYVTKTIDELGQEIICSYDPDYGLLTSTKDYNGFEALSDESASGVTKVVELPDGMKKAKVVRWSQGNDYAPQDASYYVWEKGTGQAETMVFYHKLGVELRKVTFDIDGKAIFEDWQYDDYGNVKQKSLPYYENDAKLYVTNVYDVFGRPVEVSYPDGVANRYVYDGNVVVMELLSADGKRRCVTNKYNVMNWLVEASDAGGNVISYEYFCDGLIKSAQIGNNVKTKISLTYDNCRNRSSLYDPNYGLVEYEYDSWGNIVKVKNPKNAEIEFRYDKSGRMIGKTEKDGLGKMVNSTRWFYSVEKGKNGLLNKIVSSNDHKVDYVYDDKLRLVKSIEEIQGKCYLTSYTYDDANRISSITYPSGLHILKSYSNSGYEKEISDASDGKVLWKTNSINVYGTAVDFCFGNGVETKIKYNPQTLLVDNIMVVDGDEVVQDLDYFYDGLGNVISRIKSNGIRMEETFEYDDFDRLIGVKLNGSETAKMIYDKQGNILEKKVNGVDVLYSTVYDTEKTNVILKAKTDDERVFSGFRKNMKYSLFDDLTSVSFGNDFAKIDYGYDNNRIIMKTQIDGVVKTKTYVNDCEFIKENGKEYVNTFINGPDGIFAVCVIDADGGKSYNYVHKDNLGSWGVITDDDAKIVQKMGFDAWGNVRDYDDWKEGNVEKPLFDRGFTGHEHLSRFGLINMNGRFYDPMMSMMLSPDNNIQIPQASQNFNR